MYKKNDYVVYGRDVCKVCEIEEKRFNGEDYYLLRPLKDESLKIEAPVSNKNQKIRDLISREELDNLIKKIPSISPIVANDKFIEKEYINKISSGTHEDLIQIIKTTYLRNQERLKSKKKLAEKDKSYFELAETYLYNEFSIVLNLNFDETKAYIINKIEELLKAN